MEIKGRPWMDRKNFEIDKSELDFFEPKECSIKPCRKVVLLRYPEIK